METVKAGGAIDPKQFYYVTTPTFEVYDESLKWMTKKMIPARQYAKSKVVIQGGRNLDAVNEVVEALNLVQACLLIESNSCFDFDMAAYELYTHGHAEMIRELSRIWQI